MQSYFYTVADALQPGLQATETLLLNFAGEASDFVRFNHARVRQAGTVTRRRLSLDLIDGERHASGEVELAGRLADDLPRLTALLEGLRAQREHLPPDPFLSFAVDGRSTEDRVTSSCPDASEALEAITAYAEGLDLVGIWASGAIHTGFASSLGQRNWHSCDSFNLDWSCYHSGDKAVKANYAGLHWDAEILRQRLGRVRSDIEYIARQPRSIRPGRYRVFLAPRALQEVVEMMAWGGFGLKSQRTGQSPLQRLQDGDLRLNREVNLSENRLRGLVPRFTRQGFLPPDQVSLIRAGAHDGALVDSRSAREYGVNMNAPSEWPASLEMAPGTLEPGDVLDALGTGLYINNLWYLNYADRNAARITGMTRFACFWVEDGRIEAPVDVMRFDDSIYHMLGDHLLGLTTERELLLDTATYGGRSGASAELPGALIEDLRFTL
jgi:predicted Zn-dependent protease